MKPTTNNYKANVIEVNANMKIEKASLNGAIKLLIHLAPLTKEQNKYFSDILKDELKYNNFKAAVRTTKSGKYSPFYCLQAWYKLTK